MIDTSHTVFSGHQNELWLLDAETLSAVVDVYTLDRLASKTLSSFQEERFMDLALNGKRSVSLHFRI